MPETKLLDLKIELGRERLNDLVKKFGLTDKRVLNYDSRFQKLIVQRQRMEFERLVAM